MREIKFRAWDGSVMRYTTAEDMPEFCVMDGKAYTLFDGESCFPKARDWPVMQYAGLKDKNGKEIYEGDIVHYDYQPGKGYWNAKYDAVITFKNTGFHIEPLPGNGGLSGWLCSVPGAYMPSCQELFEVIGNIHENPELLESP